MQSVSPELSAAVESLDRVLAARVGVDWDNDSDLTTNPPAGIDNLSMLVAGYSLDRSVVGDLPDAARLVQGSAAAQARITLGAAPMLQPAATIGVAADIAGYNSTVLPPEVFGPYGIDVPAGIVQGQYVLGIISIAPEAGLVMPYLLPDDVSEFSSFPADPGWLARLCDTADGTQLRTQIHGRFAGPADVAYSGGWYYGWRPNLGSNAFSMAVVAVGPTVPNRPGVWKVAAADQTNQTGSTTSHTTPTITTPVDGCLLVSVFARRAGATGATTWTGPAGDTVLSSGMGGHASVNVDLLVAVSDPVPAGTYSKTATTGGAVSNATMGIVALAPVQEMRDQPAGWYFSPLNTESALARKHDSPSPVVLDLKVHTDTGPQTVRRLVGTTRTITTRSRGVVELSVLDRREELRTQLMCPPLSGDVTGGPPYGANATWLITEALLTAGFAPCPRPAAVYRRSTTDEPPMYSTSSRLLFTLHGSLLRNFAYQYSGTSNWGPPAGQYNDTVAFVSAAIEVPVFVEGPHGLAAYARSVDSGTAAIVSWIGDSFDGPSTLQNGDASGRMWCWLRGDTAGPGNLGWLTRLDIEGTYLSAAEDYLALAGVNADRELAFQILTSSLGTPIDVTGPTLPTDDEWHFVGVGWDLQATTPTVYFNLDGTVTSTTVAPGTFLATASEGGDYSWFSCLPISDLQLAGMAQAEPWASSFTRDAYVDPSSLELKAVMEQEPREAWGLITELADAEGAVVHLDEAGVFRYRTRDRYHTDQMLNRQTTLTAARNIATIRAEHAIDVVRNQVSTTYQEPRLQPDWVTSLSDPVKVPAGTQFQYLTVQLDAHLRVLSSTITPLTTPPASGGYAMFNLAADGSGTPVTANVSVSLAQATLDGRVILQLSNTNGVPVWLTEVRLWGMAPRLRPTGNVVESDRASISRYGQQPLSLPSSQWRQTDQVARVAVRHALVDLAQPQTVITDLEVRGDPRLQLLDRVGLVDREGLGLDGDFWVTGIRETYDAGSGALVQRVDARRALDIAEWDIALWNQAMWSDP